MLTTEEHKQGRTEEKFQILEDNEVRNEMHSHQIQVFSTNIHNTHEFIHNTHTNM